MNLKTKQKLDKAINEFQKNRIDASQKLLKEIIKSGFESYEVYKYLLYISIIKKDISESHDYYIKASSLDSSDTRLHFNYGKFLIDIKNYKNAEIIYKKIISLGDHGEDVIINLSAAFLHQKKYNDAKILIEENLSKDNMNIQLNINYASILIELNHCDQAISTLNDLKNKDINFDALIVLSNAYIKQKNYYSALFYLNKCMEFDNTNIDVLLKISFCHKKLSNFEFADAVLDKIFSIDFDNEKALLAKGEIYLELNKYNLSREIFKKIKNLNNYDLSIYLYLQLMLFEWDFKKIDLQRKNNKNIPLMTLVLSEKEAFAQENIVNWINERQLTLDKISNLKNYNHKKIRLGYFSSDLREHAVSYLIAELIELHDRTQFEVYAFSFDPGRIGDTMRPRLMDAFDHWHDVQSLSDIEVAKLARTLEIDIAINLNGHTQGARNDIFAYRAAPIQINYLGYPGTMGADYMDYILADRIVIPEENQKYYSEKVLYLPDCYQANDTKRPIAEEIPTRAECGLPETGFVFACFNASYKITPEVFDSWMRILSAVEGSVLWILAEGDEARKNLQQEAEKRQINKKRIKFMERVNTKKHIARQKLADLFLDTSPYNAHTTASDALLVGLPILTKIGKTFPARVSASLLTAIGLEELITKSSEEYEKKAIELAQDPKKLQEIKAKLLQNKETYPLFNTRRFTKNIECLYVEIKK